MVSSDICVFLSLIRQIINIQQYFFCVRQPLKRSASLEAIPDADRMARRVNASTEGGLLFRAPLAVCFFSLYRLTHNSV